MTEQWCFDMKREELDAVVKEVCPEMLSHANFMHAAECIYCKEIPNDGERIANSELEAWHKLSARLDSATVSQVIEYLKTHFKPDDKLCYMDYVQGCKNDCTYMTIDQLGKDFFYYVKDLKERNMKKYKISKNEEDQIYPYVEDNDVILH